MTDYPILEFDPDNTALIEPAEQQPHLDISSAAVACFFPEVIESVCEAGARRAQLPSREPLWEIDYGGKPLAVFYPGQGGPLASVVLERVIAAGCRAIVACGGAGALNQDLALGHVVIVDAAVRDEGTSYHYLAPEREVSADPHAVRVLQRVAERSGARLSVGKTWTTDAFFRETRGRIARRRNEGCLVVEQEAATMLAVAQFRCVGFGQYLYAGDDVSGAAWAERGWLAATDVRHGLFRLAAEAALELSSGIANADKDPSSAPLP